VSADPWKAVRLTSQSSPCSGNIEGENREGTQSCSRRAGGHTVRHLEAEACSPCWRDSCCMAEASLVGGGWVVWSWLGLPGEEAIRSDCAQLPLSVGLSVFCLSTSSSFDLHPFGVPLACAGVRLLRPGPSLPSARVTSRGPWAETSPPHTPRPLRLSREPHPRPATPSAAAGRRGLQVTAWFFSASFPLAHC
jgi:hypothetical protein